MKKLGIALLLMVLLVVGAGLLFREPIGPRLFARAVETGVARDVIGDLPDGIHVALCGTGSPLPDPSRAGPCSAVIIDGKMFIVDIGGGAVRNLGLMGLAPGATEALLLTHFHSDHIDGMGELMLQRWAAGGRDAPLPVIAPEGVEPIVIASPIMVKRPSCPAASVRRQGPLPYPPGRNRCWSMTGAESGLPLLPSTTSR